MFIVLRTVAASKIENLVQSKISIIVHVFSKDVRYSLAKLLNKYVLGIIYVKIPFSLISLLAISIK